LVENPTNMSIAQKWASRLMNRSRTEVNSGANGAGRMLDRATVTTNAPSNLPLLNSYNVNALHLNLNLSIKSKFYFKN